MIEEHHLMTFRDNIAKAFAAGMKTFPDYTLHGKEHLDEVDRICLLFVNSIPRPGIDAEGVGILRLALIMHDIAMVDVPTSEREAELRKEMGPGVSFADMVRKTHQNEITGRLTRRADGLFDAFPGASVNEINSAVTVARFHRFHPLGEAPENLKGLCALMRLIDELDIGPSRAPLQAYKSNRGRMDQASKFHWIKHICTTGIARTFPWSLMSGRTAGRTLPTQGWPERSAAGQIRSIRLTR